MIMDKQPQQPQYITTIDGKRRRIEMAPTPSESTEVYVETRKRKRLDDEFVSYKKRRILDIDEVDYEIVEAETRVEKAILMAKMVEDKDRLSKKQQLWIKEQHEIQYKKRQLLIKEQHDKKHDKRIRQQLWITEIQHKIRQQFIKEEQYKRRQHLWIKEQHEIQHKRKQQEQHKRQQLLIKEQQLKYILKKQQQYSGF